MNKKIFFSIALPFLLEGIILILTFTLCKNIVWLEYSITVLSIFLLTFCIYKIINPKYTEYKNIQNKTEGSNNQNSENISIIAHELRSPLTSVSGYLNAIKDNVIPNDKQAQYIDICIEETKKTIQMLENFMSLSKFDLKQIKLNKESFDVNELIRILLIEKLPFIENKNIEPDIKFEKDIASVFADKQYITLVISNLLDNAIKYGRQNGKIFISTNKYNNKIQISISDNGIGISKEDLPNIWDRFYQVDNSTHTYKGHGLGLALVKEIISAHNEEISVLSELDKGTSFTFTLQSYSNKTM